MNVRSVILPGVVWFALCSLAGAQELPSAPSATVEQQRKAEQERQKQQQQEQNNHAVPALPADPASAPAPQPAPGQPAAQPGGAAAATTDVPVGSLPKPDEEERTPLTTIRKSVDEVNLIFTVTDKHGRFVKNLTREDFRVLDDQKPPAAVLGFRTETDLPLRVGLLVDASNSIRDRFKFEQEAAIEFLNQIVRPKYDRAFVLGFDTTAEITQDFTDSTEKLSKGVRVLRPGGGTAMFDALYYACRDKLLRGPAESGPTRRAIILLSDGEDNQSRVTREEAIEMAQRAEVIVYAISTNISGTKLRGDKVLERLSEATGGRAFFPFKVQDVADSFSDIQDELRSQYALSYKPADFIADGRFRSISVVSQNNKKLQVRARKGYFAPKQ